MLLLQLLLLALREQVQTCPRRARLLPQQGHFDRLEQVLQHQQLLLLWPQPVALVLVGPPRFEPLPRHSADQEPKGVLHCPKVVLW